MWSLHPGGNQKICSGGPQKRLQDGRITLLEPLFWHAKHAQNARAKIEPNTIGEGPRRGPRARTARGHEEKETWRMIS